MMQLAAATGALWAANNGGALLKTLRDKEQGESHDVSRRAALVAALALIACRPWPRTIRRRSRATGSQRISASTPAT